MQNNMPDILDKGFSRLLLDSMADGVFTLDDQGMITSWNPSMERISGYTADEAVGQPCSLLNFSLCFGKACPTGFRECGIFKNNRVDGRECFLRHKNGNDIFVVKTAKLVKDQTGYIKGVVETVTDLTELQRAKRKVEDAARRLGEIHCLDNIIGKSNAMKEVFSLIRSAASSEATVLIQGESGTGKELAAGSVHYNSSRSDMPFITVNCSALPESVLESELFGHVKGAFTGAIRDRTGRFEEAAGGTLFLDEIGEISPFIQIKLLRVLQERVIERVGESKRRKIDIRIIAATNQDLYGLVNSGGFREDLYYRLKVFPITLPPLRGRKEDIPLLIARFIRQQNEKTGKNIRDVTHEAMRILLDYRWPGNVRELENAIEHGFVLCNSDYIDIFDLPIELRQLKYMPGHAEENTVTDHRRPNIKLTRDQLLELLETSRWNKAEVARRVGLSRASIWKYMKKWDIPMQKT